LRDAEVVTQDARGMTTKPLASITKADDARDSEIDSGRISGCNMQARAVRRQLHPLT